MSKNTNKSKLVRTVELTPNTIQASGGETFNEPNCREFFENGECPKLRYLNNSCPMNIYPSKGYPLCCMKKEGIKGGITLQGDTE